MTDAHMAAVSLVDTHAHLAFEDFDSDLSEVVERAQSAGVTTVITVGIEPADWPRTLQIAASFGGVFPALGIHPNSANQATEEQLARLESLCRGGGVRVVALGETGLDYYREYAPHDVQRAAFRAHLALARELDLPVIVHNRDAHEDVLDVLKRDGQGTRGIMHSFSGDIPFAEECLRLGYVISLAGPVTFRKAVDKHQIAAWAPLNAVLVETDCPFLTPEPYRGRRNEPAYVAHTAQAIAAIRNEPFERVAAATTQNAMRAFGISAFNSANANSANRAPIPSQGAEL